MLRAEKLRIDLRSGQALNFVYIPLLVMVSVALLLRVVLGASSVVFLRLKVAADEASLESGSSDEKLSLNMINVNVTA